MTHLKTKKTVLLSSAVMLASLSSGSFFVSATAYAQTASTNLQTTIDTILSDPTVSGAQTGVVVRKATDGKTLYAHNEKSLLIPASNTKLYSSTAALSILGENYKFHTTIGTDGTLNKKSTTLRGNVYLKGRGDPTLKAEDYDKLAQQLAAKGITTIKGQVIADDTFFDDQRLGYNWGWDSNPYYYQPEISALTVAADDRFNIGALTVTVDPGQVGQPAKVSTNPKTDYVTFVNNANTGPAGSANTISVQRELGNNIIHVTGNIAADASTVSKISTVTDPGTYAATLFRAALQERGITITKAGIGHAAMPSNATSLIEHESVPLSQIFTPFLKFSNNGIAEILTKTIGQQVAGQGTWDAGLTGVLKVAKETYNVDTNQVKLVDGSGLSNVNLTTAEQTTNLLLAAQHQPIFNTWYAALPVAGESNPLVGGTLSSRMRGTKAQGNVHAKTGGLDNVSALSGYVTAADGQKLVFSIMETNYSGPSPKTPVEDKIAEALANYSE